ncbi:hypothetical protein BO71DRAFT_342164 [Aspergillus ellipticus CBS 707.79]|uniref:N-acetyltransferase domain-containing protein n=1 Tax=Aspergillus ellipticus CBS 707.79 TaxID=1448320 RepID=A0A319F4A0_9EURO|nr:hypothetical protein BO71DRAFT_342164 [Aspergillus ellipticus CBS 707.79]
MLSSHPAILTHLHLTSTSLPYLSLSLSLSQQPPIKQPPPTTGTTMSSNTAPTPPDQLTLTTKTTSNPTDQLAALRLIADSIAQQRQLAAKAILTHPASLLSLLLTLYLTYLFTNRPTDWTSLLLITWPACIAVFLLLVRYATEPYLEKAGSVGRKLLGVREHDTRRANGAQEHDKKTSDEDTVVTITTHHGTHLIGTLVLCAVRTSSELCVHVRDAAERSKYTRFPVAVIRAWTIEQRVRGVGIGRGLLEYAVGVCWERGWKGPVVSDCHANEVVELSLVGRWVGGVANRGMLVREGSLREWVEGVSTPLRLRLNPPLPHTTLYSNHIFLHKKTKMSTTTATTTGSTPTCTSSRYVLPVQDAACALPNSGNYSSVMSTCCKPASVTKYDNDCGLYCLAEKQSVKDLLDCLQTNGAETEAFCSGNLTATATASVSSASSTGSKTGTSTGGSASSTDKSAGVSLRQPGVSKLGLGVLGLFVVSGVLGVGF